MPAFVKLLIGLAAALAAGWVSHGPLGRGEAFVDSLQAQADAVVRSAELPGVTVRFARDPLSRKAMLSGPANDFQREGQGTLLGLNDRIRAVPGVSDIAWDDKERAEELMPLIAETEILVALAFLLGLGLGRLFFGGRKRRGFL